LIQGEVSIGGLVDQVDEWIMSKHMTYSNTREETFA